jgi:hypothetical protein
MAHDELEAHVREILRGIGEDPDREGLRLTPERVAKALRFLTQGYAQDTKTVLNDAQFTVSYDEMVIIKDIDVFSLCEHHMLPFFGKAHVAYLPDGKVVGLSKIPRLVDMFSRRLQVQERRGDPGRDQAARRGRGDRGHAPVHGDARGAEAELGGRHLLHGGGLPGAAPDPQRVPGVDPQAAHRPRLSRSQDGGRGPYGVGAPASSR